MLSRKIDKILIADTVPEARGLLCSAVKAIAPHADIRIVTTPVDTLSMLAQWQPILVIARLNLLQNGGRCLLEYDHPCVVPLPPFLLGLCNSTSSADIIDAMRCGFTHVIEMTHDEHRMIGEIMKTVSAPMRLDVQLNRMIAPRLYSDQVPFDLKQLNSDIEQYIFKLATAIAHSKNGISKLLGISRQLVQYHFKKNEN